MAVAAQDPGHRPGRDAEHRRLQAGGDHVLEVEVAPEARARHEMYAGTIEPAIDAPVLHAPLVAMPARQAVLDGAAEATAICERLRETLDTPFRISGAELVVTASQGVVIALGAVSTHLRSGNLRAVVISSAFPEFPDVPTMRQLGYKADILGVWFGFFMPAGVPKAVVDTIAANFQMTADGRVSSMGRIMELVERDAVA